MIFNEKQIRAALEKAWSLDTAMTGIRQREYDILKEPLLAQLP